MSFNWRLGMIAAMAASFGAWILMLGGIASIQKACEADLGGDVLKSTSLTELHALMENARNTFAQGATYAKVAAGAAATNNTALAAEATRNLSQTSLQYQRDTLLVLSTLTKRSASSIPPAFTPDHSCSDFYRYGWTLTAWQLFTLVLLVVGLATRAMHSLVLSCSVFLGVGISWAIQNGHTYFYVRHLGDAVPHDTFVSGKVFFAGCVFVVVTNCILLFLLSMYREVNYDATLSRSTSDDNNEAQKTTV